MESERVNGVRLAYEMTGAGDVPLVAIHGSWSSHETWSQVAPELSERYRVLTYDRRGHSASERPAGQGTQHEDVEDAAALIERLGLAPAFVMGNSFGAEVAILLAAERPDLVRGLVAHEPPFLPVLKERPEYSTMMSEAEGDIAPVLERIRGGDHAGAAELFVDTVAIGPGSWAHLPESMRSRMIENAPTFLDEESDPGNGTIDLARLGRFGGPALLTLGDQSPPMFAPIVRIIVEALPQAELLSFAGAGHIPHTTHPREFAEAVTAFIDKQEGETDGTARSAV
ncbi:MAG: alpha/beta hydrolase [Actinomycetota bacterium]